MSINKVFPIEFPEKYSVLGIPKSFIIDQIGKIVAKDRRGEELIAKSKRVHKMKYTTTRASIERSVNNFTAVGC